MRTVQPLRACQLQWVQLFAREHANGGADRHVCGVSSRLRANFAPSRSPTSRESSQCSSSCGLGAVIKYSFASRTRACDALGHVQPVPRPQFYQHLKLLINICYRQSIDWQCGYWFSRKRAWLSFDGGFSEQPRELNGRGDLRLSSSHDAVPELSWLPRTSIDPSASVDAVCC